MKNWVPENIKKTFHEAAINKGHGTKFEYNRKATITDYFENQVAKSPDAIALKYKSKSYTYKQLNDQANQCANFLVDIGIPQQCNIGIFLEPGIDTIICILAILKLGCCYVPLDVNYPLERIYFMLNDCSTNFILTNYNYMNKFKFSDKKIIALDKTKKLIKNMATTKPLFHATADSPAYIIYTSGSTGVPKGIIVHHRAVNNHMIWMQNYFSFDATDIILFKTPISFDPSIWEILLPLYIGAQLIIAPKDTHLSPHGLYKIIKYYKITSIQFVPSLLDIFLKQKTRISSLKSLKRVFSGGETLRYETKKLFFEKLKCNLINLYGPSETTIDITSHIYTKSENLHKNIIGKPIYNNNLLVLDKKMTPVPIGVEGELYIQGDNVAKGYINRTEDTAKCFIQHKSFSKNVMYATGDIVRWTENGELEYLYRNNNQIKINGVRIEPNELVSRILKNKKVSDCVITKRIDSHEHTFLACYIVSNNKDFDINEIKESLKNFFPSFMLPKTYTVIDMLPLTPNGKVDYSALPDPHYHQTKTINMPSDGLNDIEKTIFNIWQKLLKKSNINLTDNFFELGGHSILALELLNSIKNEFGVSLHIKDIFLYPKICDLGMVIHQKQKKNIKRKLKSKNIQLALENSIMPLQPVGSSTPLFLIHPIGGTVFWYMRLSMHLGDKRPIYGIQDPSIELKKIIFNSIEEMAECYYHIIKQVQATGPYIIGGASFGATIAIEVANKFVKNGEKIIVIPILDGWAVYPNTLKDNNYFKESMIRQHSDLKAEFKKHKLENPSELFEIQWHRLGLLWEYKMKKIKHNIAIFKAKELLPAFQAIDAPLNHWDSFSQSSINLYEVPGNHETMFQNENAKILAKLMTACFNENELS